MLICDRCGKIFCEDENKFVPETCDCGGYFETAKNCLICGAWILEEHEICEECLDCYKNTDSMLEIGSDWEEEVELNGFLLSFYSKQDIEQILIDSLGNEDRIKVANAVNRYYEEDKLIFEEYVKKKWKEEK